jgi:hypothetical protein
VRQQPEAAAFRFRRCSASLLSAWRWTRATGARSAGSASLTWRV